MPIFFLVLPEKKVVLQNLLEAIQRKGVCVTYQYALEEARRNVSIEKYGSLSILSSRLSLVAIENRLAMDILIALKEKDISILGGALGTRSTHLLTGDVRDFGSYFGKKIEGTLIVSPKMMTQIICDPLG